ncbi:HlyD family efflux transporter periplasmic adaptor subunit [Herbidospora sp. NEAU-GS84]|uniref:HlyD family efflux transporter periplasmic adaptor subunit n=1 Tax=Herbidospora solisilvae TaxID=2696284 RepID=A0A7C9NHD9_9ACTN|nr:efflux RND transporter periplasmic adaptor subunit [Herbidospora solisilvae]NAS22572.1 HlyD family efflux transporter periplasmic adaptor subunit [Herbidospora solisilvae]
MALLLALSACTAEEAPVVQTANVARAPVSEVVEAPATVGARATASLTSPAAGTVAKLYVSDGDTVKKGEILARISAPQARDRLKEAKKADRQAARPVSFGGAPSVPSLRLPNGIDPHVRKSFAQARQAARKVEDKAIRRHLLSAIDLAERQHRSQQKALNGIVGGLNRMLTSFTGQLGAGMSGLSSSMSSLQAASRSQTRAALKAAEETVEGLTIKAPFGGVVTLGGGGGSATPALPDLAELVSGGGVPAQAAGSSAGTIAEGVPVGQGETLLSVTDVSELNLRADVDETDVLLVENGTRAEVEFDAVPGAVYTAEVTGVGVTPQEGATGGVSYPVRLSLAEGRFDDGSEAPDPKPGMSAVVRMIVKESPEAVAVPAAAVVTSGRDTVVWAVVGGRAERRTVTLGAEGDAYVEVVNGVKVGDRVITRGADGVRQGQEIP